MTWLISALNGKRVYLDSNIFIYALEGGHPSASIVSELFKSFQSGRFEAVSSNLALAEVLVKPFSINDKNAIASYQNILRQRSYFRMALLTRKVLIQTAQIRSATGAKLPDAIHLATAVAVKCDLFLTADKSIKAPQNLQIILLNDLAIG